jgi:hypothetical protein
MRAKYKIGAGITIIALIVGLTLLPQPTYATYGSPENDAKFTENGITIIPATYSGEDRGTMGNGYPSKIVISTLDSYIQFLQHNNLTYTFYGRLDFNQWHPTTYYTIIAYCVYLYDP